jgi:putative selenate reductase
MEAVRAGDLAAAVDSTRADNPMAAVLGRACTHPCEKVCTRTHYDAPLAIREMKRFVMEHERVPGTAAGTTPRGGAKVAVIGGGPCGLAAAWELTRAGHPVTVFEARPYCGGMVQGTIPAYRAVQAVIDQDLAFMKSEGMDVRHGVTVGRDVSLADIRAQGFRTIVLAVGAQKGIALGIPGEDAAGVLDGLDFLRAVREGRAPSLGRRVGVVGGGDVAMDCARTARRLSDGEVVVIYRRTRAQMPAQREEIDEVLAEGIVLRELLAPESVTTGDSGTLAALKCAHMTLGEPDGSGRRRPVPTGETEDVPLDMLIVASGQEVDPEVLAGLDVRRTRGGWLVVGDDLGTGIEGVYAGGDLIDPGPQTIVKAVGDGKRIGDGICGLGGTPFLKKAGSPEPPPAKTFMQFSPPPPGEGQGGGIDLVAMLKHRSRLAPRVPVPHRELDCKSFEETIGTYSVDEARAEAGRCLRCDLLCSVCASVCPNRAFFTYEVPGVAERVAAGPAPAALVPAQRFQTAVLTDFCNECGNCATFCPTAGRPYQDKPRLYLARGEFEAQRDNAYMISGIPGSWRIEARVGGETHELRWDEQLRYSCPDGAATFDPGTFEQLDGSAGLDRGTCATMWTLLRGITGSMSHLPFRDT